MEEQALLGIWFFWLIYQRYNERFTLRTSPLRILKSHFSKTLTLRLGETKRAKSQKQQFRETRTINFINLFRYWMHIIIFHCRWKLMVKIPPPPPKYLSYGHALYKHFFILFSIQWRSYKYVSCT